MRFLGLVLLIVAAVSHCQAATVEELIRTANNEGAPFTSVALQRLHNPSRWGAKRANRTSDIVFMNASGRSFKIGSGACVNCNFSFGLYPKVRVHQFSSTVWGIESNYLQRNLTCTLIYQCGSPPSDCFGLTVFNPVDGETSVDVFKVSVPDLKVDYGLDKGKNNQIRILVTTRTGMGRFPMLSSNLGAPPAGRKLKGSRNKFVKATKNGFGVYTM